jgi:hypothetical protein
VSKKRDQSEVTTKRPSNTYIHDDGIIQFTVHRLRRGSIPSKPTERLKLVLEVIEKRAKKVLRENRELAVGKKFSWSDIERRLAVGTGGFWSMSPLLDQLPEAVREAVNALNALTIGRRELDKKNIASASLLLMRAAVCDYRIQVLTESQRIRAANKSREGRSKAKKNRRENITKKMGPVRAARLTLALEENRKYPNLSCKQIYQRVGSALGDVTAEAIRKSIDREFRKATGK